jgi:hypothetical protein
MEYLLFLFTEKNEQASLTTPELATVVIIDE